MLNMLVVDDNFDFAKILINSVSQQNRNVRLCHIATNGKETLDIINNKGLEIDIILLDLLLPKYNGCEILQLIQSMYLNRFQESIIVISGDLNMISKVKNSPLLFSSIPKMAGIEKIVKEVDLLIQYKEKSNVIEKSIINELTYLGYNLSHKGTQYLVDVISSFYHSNKSNFNLKRNVYPNLAMKYNTTESNIKVDISKATEYMYYECAETKAKEYFKSNLDGKIKPKLVINTILNKLRYELL